MGKYVDLNSLKYSSVFEKGCLILQKYLRNINFIYQGIHYSCMNLVSDLVEYNIQKMGREHLALQLK